MSYKTNLILILLPACQILVNLPETRGYLAYERKQCKLVKSGNRSVREKAVSLTLLFLHLFSLLLVSFTPG